jgi:AraC-like DNA-binding protein
MAESLFNFHDLILLLTSFECIVFAFIIYSNKFLNKYSYTLFALLLLSHSFIALHELIFWGATFREWVLALSPNLFFILNFSYLIDGPLVYLFVCSLFLSNFKLTRSKLLHFIPVIIFTVYIYFAFWSLQDSEKVNLIRSYDIAYSWHYVIIDLLIKSVRIAYVIITLRLVKRYINHDSAHVVKRTPWVQYILTMFLVLLLWEWSLTAIKVFGLNYSINLKLLEFIGLADYYTKFALINLILYVVLMEVINKGHFKKIKQSEPVNLEYVERIEESMKREKIYLNPNLSFERFSEKIDIPVKELSFTINNHFNMNFYEYINQYRIKEAKERLIAVENIDKNITEIFYSAGFNSKSVYNTLFKKLYKSTPSQYRKQALAK